MMMDFKDYYAVLGVSENADAKTIKKAYQQLAKKYHPDANQGDSKAEEKFKEINEAYQAVSDPEKRKKYDELKQNYQQWQAHGGRDNFDWSRWQAHPGDETYTRTVTPEEFAEMFGDLGLGGHRKRGPYNTGGPGGFSDFFSTIFGFEAEPSGYGRNQARARAGEDIEIEVPITLEEAYHGTVRVIDTANKEIQAKIPKGVRTGSKVRVAGQGGHGVGGGARGNIYLLITVEPHDVFQREGNDLTTLIPLDFYTAVLGGEIKIQTLNGSVNLKIPPMAQSGKKFRLKEKGMPLLESPHKNGDLFAEVRIKLPDQMSEKEINTLRELAAART